MNALETSAYIPLEIRDGFSSLKIHYEYLHFAFLTFKINDSSYILLNKVPCCSTLVCGSLCSSVFLSLFLTCPDQARHFSTADATRRARRPPAGPLDWKSLPESDLAARRTEFEFIRVVLLGLGVIRITGRPTRPAAPHPGPEGPRTQDSRARPASVPVAATVTASGPAAFRRDRPPTRRSERPKAAKPTASRPALTAAVDPAGPDPVMDAQGPIG